jgi:hypothetical protein
MLEIQRIRTIYPVGLFPLLACPVRTGGQQPMQNGNEHGTLQVE